MEKDFNVSACRPSPPPRWDLTCLFPGPDSLELKQNIDQALTFSRDFSTAYAGKMAGLPPHEFVQALNGYEELAGQLALISTYAGLVASVDAGQASWQQSLAEQLKPVAGNLLFLPQEIARMDEGDLLDKLTDPSAARFIPFLRCLRAGKDNLLSDELERFLIDLAPASSSSWVRLYRQADDALRFDHKGRKLTSPEISNVVNGAGTSLADRRAAWEEQARVYAENAKTFALVTNTLADIKAVDDRWRKFKDPAAARHQADQIEPPVVRAMTDAVREAYPRLAHRYYAWKAEKMGQARLHPADRNAPLGCGGKVCTWDEAQKIVMKAFDEFSPEFSRIGGRFFAEGWIDAEPREGKTGGAFCADPGPLGHPCILMNFYGGSSDVRTLAHELGHGIHQVMAAGKGALMSDASLPLSETASMFAEALVFRAMFEAETDPAARRDLLAERVEDMLNTVVRQTAFYQFETAVHAERREKGELSPERLNEIYVEVQKESLGPAVDMNVRNAGALWAAVPHFVESPFYVYAYPAGSLLVNALCDAFDKSADKDDFKARYMDFLSAGGTGRHRDLLAVFGLDASDPAFWQKGLSVIERHIDELIALDRDIAAGLAPPSGRKVAGKGPAA